jgi:hypothetical protein
MVLFLPKIRKGEIGIYPDGQNTVKISTYFIFTHYYLYIFNFILYNKNDVIYNRDTTTLFISISIIM